VVFLFVDRLERLLGPTLAHVISRLLGILLAALAVQYVLDGLRNAFGIGAA
jgi:multiple antibiotic resistance protein